MTDTHAGQFGRPGSDGEPSEHGPTVRDRRRIDPVTGQVRPEARQDPPAGPGEPPGGKADAPESPGSSGPVAEIEAIEALEAQVAERTADLQRVQAEYTNYRRRVERDRDVVRQVALAGALSELLPVLDDIGRARQHGDLTGAFKAVADALDAAVARLGLTRFGEAGDPFDPNRHEALLHAYSDDVTETTCTQILQPGYQLGERVLRPARVAVADPTEALPPEQSEQLAAPGVDAPGEGSPHGGRTDGPGTPFGV